MKTKQELEQLTREIIKAIEDDYVWLCVVGLLGGSIHETMLRRFGAPPESVQNLMDVNEKTTQVLCHFMTPAEKEKFQACVAVMDQFTKQTETNKTESAVALTNFLPVAGDN